VRESQKVTVIFVYLKSRVGSSERIADTHTHTHRATERARHRKYKSLKFGGSKAHDLSLVQTAVTSSSDIRTSAQSAVQNMDCRPKKVMKKKKKT
jgi:hypothetical protein